MRPGGGGDGGHPGMLNAQRSLRPGRVSAQRGIALVEALIGILIFSVGVLALVGMQAVAIQMNSDAKYRADAAYLVNQLVSAMWSDMRADEEETWTRLKDYEYQPDGQPCTPADGQAALATTSPLKPWLAQVDATLPGAGSALQQVKVDDLSLGGQRTLRVTVSLCWQVPRDSEKHSHVGVAYVNQ